MTDRTLTVGMTAEVQAPLLRPVMFYEGEFATGFLRLFLGVGSLAWDGKTWTGGGQLLAISPLGESTEIAALGFTVTLSGMPSALVSLVLQSLRQGKPGKLWLGCLNADGTVVADPVLAQQGKFDVAVIDDDGAQATITATYESRLVELLKARERRYTTEDQQIDYPGDLGFDMVQALQDVVLIWGGGAAAASPVAAPAAAAVVQSEPEPAGRVD